MFRPLKYIAENDLKSATIANSQAITLGDAIQPAATGHNQFVTPATTSGLILGVVVSILQNGKVPEVSTVTVGSDNETTAKYTVRYIPSFVPMEFEADLDAAATGDNNAICFLTLATAATLNHSTASNLFGGTPSQFSSFGVSSFSTTKVRGRFYQTL